MLLEKLQRYGIRGVVHSWLSSYLEKKYQYVQANHSKSQLLQVVCGVSKVLKLILFADDTNLFSSGENFKYLDIVEKELTLLKNWFDFNKLLLKEIFFIMFVKCLSNSINKLMINQVEIERVSDIKSLGVITDNKLS